MQRKSWGSIEGVVDVGIIVIAHVMNPARNDAIDFLKRVLTGDIRAIIPTSAFLGAYHVLTRYLRVPRLDAKKSLVQTLEIEAPMFYEDIKVEQVIDGLDLASVYNIESWDGYLISLAQEFDAHIIFTIDRNFRKIPWFSVVNPIPDKLMEEYHQWLLNMNR